MIISPIALASAKKALERRQNGEAIKGTGRRRTAYVRPPIVKLIAMCGSVQALGRLRGALALGSFKGTIAPSEKTERAWEEAFWKRVVALMLSSKRPTFIYNEVMAWPKPRWAEDAIEYAFHLQCIAIPSPAEQMKARGIIIEGVTSR